MKICLLGTLNLLLNIPHVLSNVLGSVIAGPAVRTCLAPRLIETSHAGLVHPEESNSAQPSKEFIKTGSRSSLISSQDICLTMRRGSPLQPLGRYSPRGLSEIRHHILTHFSSTSNICRIKSELE
jgi:hypothetical protein